MSSFSKWPYYSTETICSVSEVLSSGKVNYWSGEQCSRFEEEFASFCGVSYAVSLCNGTVALDLALRSLGIGSGDDVIVTSRTFLASVSSIINSGATPVFADVNLDTQNISIHSIRAVLTNKTKAIMCVHLAGWPCDMDPIIELANELGLYVIEDCAQAHGAKYKGRSVGSIGDIGAWSFCQDKIITTGGEGGMVTTNDSTLWSKIWSFKDHGKSWESVYVKKHPPGFRWLHDSFGTNGRMTEMQAAIGRIQLKQMAHWTARRISNAEAIWNAARQCNLFRVPELRCDNCDCFCDTTIGCSHAAYKCYVFVNGDEVLRDAVMAAIIERGVPCFSGSCSEVYLEHAFDGSDFRPKERLPNAKMLGETSIMFLCHPTLTEADMQKTCDVIREVARAFE